MAEVVGTIAAVLQLAETALKLKELYSSIRDAPKDLADLVEEVLALADLLADIRAPDFGQCQTTADTQSWKRCHKLLEGSVVAMRDVVSDLESTLKNHKRTGKLRLHLKREELKKCSDRMERLKTTLMAAQQSYSFALLTQQNALLLKEVRSMAMEQQANAHKTRIGANNTSAQPSKPPVTNDAANPTGTSNIISTRSAQAAQSRRSYAYHLRLPPWIYRRALSILIETSNNSWGATLQTYNQLPNDAEVFRHAQKGQWSNVRDLFNAGRASPFDVIERGKTLLDVAMGRMDLAGLKFLMQYGKGRSEMWKTECNWMDYICICVLADELHLASPVALAADFSRYEEVLIFILHEFRDLLGYDDELVFYLRDTSILPSEWARSVIDASFLPYEFEDKLDRAEAAIRTQSLDAQTVRIMLGRDQTLHEAFHLLVTSSSKFDHRYLFGETAKKIGMMYDPNDTGSAAVRAQIEILAEIVSFEATECAVLPFTSGIFSFLSGRHWALRVKHKCSFVSVRSLTAEVRIWIQLLKDSAVDLERYGRAEHQWLATMRSRWELTSYRDTVDGQIILVGYITYGPEVEDWNVWVVPEPARHYEMAGAFWCFVENPELFSIPGAFLEAEEVEYGKFEHQGVFIQAPCM